MKSTIVQNKVFSFELFFLATFPSSGTPLNSFHATHIQEECVYKHIVPNVKPYI